MDDVDTNKGGAAKPAQRCTFNAALLGKPHDARFQRIRQNGLLDLHWRINSEGCDRLHCVALHDFVSPNSASTGDRDDEELQL